MLYAIYILLSNTLLSYNISLLCVFTHSLYASIGIFSCILILTWESVCSVMSAVFCNNRINVSLAVIRHGICIYWEKLCKVSYPFDWQ